jgi:hypothetical protein
VHLKRNYQNLVHNVFPEGLMGMLPLFSALATCLVALCCIEPGKPSRSAVVVLEMRDLGSKLPDLDLRNPDTMAGSFFGARERQALAEADMVPVTRSESMPSARSVLATRLPLTDVFRSK